MADPGPGAAQINQVVVAQAQDDPDALFQQLLRRILSNDFDGQVKVALTWSGFTDPKAQELGLALLEKKDEIQTLSFPICSLSLSERACPAFLEYFETSVPSVKLVVVGSGDIDEQTPVTSSEMLDVLLQKLAKQDRVKPSILLSHLVLSTRSLLYLKSFEMVTFVFCDLSGEHDSSRLAVIPASDTSQTIMDQRTVAFDSDTSVKLIKASQCLLMAKVCSILAFCDPEEPNDKRQIDSVIALAKSIKVAEKLSLAFTNLDTDGSLVADTLTNLSSFAKVVPLSVSFFWNAPEGPMEEAIRQRAPGILEIYSRCRFIKSMVKINGASIFDANQSMKMEEIAEQNFKIPLMVDTFPQEFWMQNLVVLKALLTPDRLFHPRFSDVYYRLLRRNFDVLRLLMECYRPPLPVVMGPASRTRLRRAAALRDEKKRKSSLELVQYDGPARRTRLRCRANAQS